jgi:hypothetical protein
MSTVTQDSCLNRLLQTLSSESFVRLQPHLEHIDLPVKMDLVAADEDTSHVVFIESGIASMVATCGTGEHRVEVGHIGREGLAGFHILLDADRTPNHTFMSTAEQFQASAAE